MKIKQWKRLAAPWQRIRPLLAGWRMYWRGVQLVVAAAPWPATASLALIMLLSVVPVMQVWLMKRLVDVLSAPVLATSHIRSSIQRIKEFEQRFAFSRREVYNADECKTS